MLDGLDVDFGVVRVAVAQVLQVPGEAADRGLWENPNPETMAAMQQVYLDVEGELEE